MKAKHYITLYCIIVLLLCSAYTFSGSNIPQENLNRYMSSNAFGFIENKGQYVDDKGNPADFILFKASLRNTDVYVTTKGITYVFLKYEKQDSIHKTLQNRLPRSGNTDEQLPYPQKVEWCRLDMEIAGADIRRENVIAEDRAGQGCYNYYFAHCPQGIRNVFKYKKITVKNIYPGIDWVIYTNEEHLLKYDFVLHPGANPDNIRISYKGAEKIESLNSELQTRNSKLHIKTPFGEVIEGNLVCYEKETGKQITSEYEVSNDEIQFKLHRYNKGSTLIIDPPMELVWATYYSGSSEDNGTGMAIDEAGNIFITGWTNSADFPTLNNGTYYQGTSVGGWRDAFILKFDNTGELIWGTYFGGTDFDIAQSIAADNSGNVFVTGQTSSIDIPTLNPGGSAYYDNTYNSIITIMETFKIGDMFISGFDNNGTLEWSTYYGGKYRDVANCITADNSGNIFITGETVSTNFPCFNPGGGAYFRDTLSYVAPLDTVNMGPPVDFFILKFRNNGERLWAAYYGGTGYDAGNSIVADNTGSVFVTGSTTSADFLTYNMPGAYFQPALGAQEDAFILKFDNICIQQWATYYGGSDADRGFGITTDNTCNVFVAGYTWSTDFPMLNPGGGTYSQGYGGNLDLFISKFSNGGVQQWSTFYGGNTQEDFVCAKSITVDKSGNLFTVNETHSMDVPTYDPGCGAYFQGTNASENCWVEEETFIMQFDSVGVRGWATYYGGYWNEYDAGIAVDTSGCLFVAITTTSSDMPVLNPNNGAYFQGPSGNYEQKLGIMKFCPICCLDIDIQPAIETVCTGDSVTFFVQVTSNSTSVKNYQWLFNDDSIPGATDSFYTVNPVSPAEAGNYSCIVSNSCKTDTSSDAVLNVSIPPANAGNDISICSGSAANLSASGGVSYQWNTTETNQSIIVVPVVNVTYMVTVTDTIGCTDTDDVTVTLKSLPTADAGADQTICNGETATLTASGGTAYQWNTISTGAVINITPSLTSTYTVTATDNGCTDSDEVIVVVNPLPQLSAGNDTVICIDSTARLTAGGALNYVWNTGETSYSITVLPQITTTYTVTGSDALCSNTDVVVVTVNGCALTAIYIPNVFTPNGDGDNDVFKPVHTNIAEFEMYIFDRWGQEIFYTTDINTGWDGKFEDKPCPQGVYSWFVYYKGIDDTEKQKKNGHITLIR